MKNIKRILAVALAVLMVLSLSACGSFEAKMAKAAQKMSKLESMRMDVDMDMDMKLSMLGEELALDADLEVEADVLRSPMTLGGSMNLEFMDEELGCLFYMEKAEEGLGLYLSSDNGKTWIKKNVELSAEVPEFDVMSNLGELAKLAATFKETGTEEIRGSNATVYSGYIPGEEISKGLSSINYAELEDVELDFSALSQAQVSDTPATIAIDNKSGMVVRCTLDMTEILQDMMKLVMDIVLDQVAEEIGLEGVDLSALGMTVEVSQAEARMEFYDFDAVRSIDHPQNVLAA